MPSLLLIVIASVCIAVGLAALWFLVKQRRWWPACFLTSAYGAALYMIYATLLTSSGASPTLSLAIVTCAYAVMLTVASVCTQSPNLKDRTILGAGLGAFALLLLFVASTSLPHFGREAFASFGVALTGGVLLASTIVGNVFARRGTIAMGSQTKSHILFYGSILTLLVQAVVCSDEQDVVGTLLLSVIFTSAGTAGVVYEADSLRGRT